MSARAAMAASASRPAPNPPGSRLGPRVVAGRKLTNGSNFPFFHNVNGTKQVFYRACWVGNNNKKGPWSTTVSYGFGNKAAA
jgi:hypothetical protein